jgi:pyridoxal/pyridoxine/pyridoxamine kinase
MLATQAADSYEMQLVAAQDALAKPAHAFRAERMA